MLLRLIIAFLGLGQLLLGTRVIARMARTVGGERLVAMRQDAIMDGSLSTSASRPTTDGLMTVVVPVLNEIERLGACLEGLTAQGASVKEILVVDGGSSDGTPALVAAWTERDGRIRCLDASPVPADWNGKAWGLQVGLEQADPATVWLLTIDADVRPTPALTDQLLQHTRQTGLTVLSLATLQEVAGPGLALLHPAMLTTLVYRFGIPGHAAVTVDQVQANGQCMLFDRSVLSSIGGFGGAATSLCEDVTLARLCVAAGHPVGFFEAGDLVSVAMYRTWQEAWQNWPRSLLMRDHLHGWAAAIGWLEVTLVQALPLPLLFILLLTGLSRWLLLLNAGLVVMRLGVLIGTARAYRDRPWPYWLSPVCDLPVAWTLWRAALRRRHHWRGRTMVWGGR